MSIHTVKGVSLRGIAGAVSTRYIPTDSYTDLIGADAIASFKKSSGVEGRYLVLPNQTAGDLCYAAAKKLLETKGIDPEEVGVLVLVTQSPDYGEPATACVLQYRLGLPQTCAAFDVTLGCSGYAYGLNIGANLLSTSDKRYALVLAGDTKGMDPTEEDRAASNSVKLLLGDAGTATLLEKAEGGEMTFQCETDGSGFRATGNCYRGYRHPIGKTPAFMDDVDVFNFIVSTGPRMMKEYMERMGTTPEDYDCFALHQASMFSLKQIARRMKIPMEKLPLSLERFGNTGPASIPMALVSAFGDETGSRKLRTLMCGFGVGLSASATSAVLDTAEILPLVQTDEWFDDGMFETK